MQVLLQYRQVKRKAISEIKDQIGDEVKDKMIGGATALSPNK